MYQKLDRKFEYSVEKFRNLFPKQADGELNFWEKA